MVCVLKPTRAGCPRCAVPTRRWGSRIRWAWRRIARDSWASAGDGQRDAPTRRTGRRPASAGAPATSAAVRLRAGHIGGLHLRHDLIDMLHPERVRVDGRGQGPWSSPPWRLRSATVRTSGSPAVHAKPAHQPWNCASSQGCGLRIAVAALHERDVPGDRQPGWRLPREQRHAAHVGPHEARHRIHHGEAQLLPAGTALARQQCHADRLRGIHRGDLVGEDLVVLRGLAGLHCAWPSATPVKAWITLS